VCSSDLPLKPEINPPLALALTHSIPSRGYVKVALIRAAPSLFNGS